MDRIPTRLPDALLLVGALSLAVALLLWAAGGGPPSTITKVVFCLGAAALTIGGALLITFTRSAFRRLDALEDDIERRDGLGVDAPDEEDAHRPSV